MPIRRGLVFANPEGTIFANPEGSCFCQSGGELFLLRLKWTEEKRIKKGIRLLRDRVGTSDCTGNLPFIKDQTNKIDLNSDIGYTKSKLKKSL